MILVGWRASRMGGSFLFGRGSDDGNSAGGRMIVPSLNTIREARSFLAGHFAATRLIGAPYLSARTGKRIYLKLEAELPTGSFKVRGALYALATRLKRGAVEEVIASSTGNHGAAVAYAAKLTG